MSDRTVLALVDDVTVVEVGDAGPQGPPGDVAASAVTSVNGNVGDVVGLAETVDLDAETAARIAADNAETAARIAADNAETAARIAADTLAIPLAQRGAVNGVATLDGAGTVPDVQIPATITRDTELAAAIAELVDSSPATLDTLAELAGALGNDPNLAATLTTMIGTKIPLAQRGAVNGVATLDGAGTVPDVQIPATITRDSELAAAIAPLATVVALAAEEAARIGDVNAEEARALAAEAAEAVARANGDALALVKTANLSDLANVVTALQNLGIDRTGIADGQLLAWSAALVKFIPVNPTGASELVYAENVTAIQTAVAAAASAAGALVDIPGCSITVPASARPVWLEAAFGFTQTVAGQGQATLLLIETTGAATTVHSGSTFLPNNVGPRSQNGLLFARMRLGATAVPRTFKLTAQCAATGATVPTFNTLNSPTKPSYITALAA